MRAVVVGGGVAGAASAIALRRIGWAVTVHEAHTDPAGPYGSFVSLASNGLRGLAALGCLTAVQEAGFPVLRQRMWSGRGKLLGDVPRGRRADDPLASVTLNRSDLVSVLRQQAVAAGAKIVTGERVDPGRLPDADLVVGADGIWSAIRPWLDAAAPVPRYASLYTTSGVSNVFASAAEPGFEPKSFNLTFGRRGAFIHLPAPDGSVWWSAQVAAPIAPDLPSVTIESLMTAFSGEPRVGQILRAARPGITSTLNHVLDPVPAQAGEYTVLVGDAAHPVGVGQGASMAIEDAVILARQLRQDDPSGGVGVAASLAAFVELRRGRLGKLATSAASNRDAKTAGPLVARLRDAIMPFTFNRFYERATGWLYDFDPGELPSGRSDQAA
ncbi:MAG: FAD-dependent monooxygenase [Nakamurella sp.]